MVDYVDMSSDRMIACRVFSGEIMRIRTKIIVGNHDAELLNQVINYLEMRIDEIKMKEYKR